MASIEVPRALVPDDAAALVALSAEAGWNQTADDWRVIVSAGAGEAVFIDGTPVASACAVPLTTRSDWICMVLVTAAARRRGHATRLMARQIQRIRAAGRVPGLDATELGRPVYQQLGFADHFTLSRFRAEAPRWTGGPDIDAHLRPMTRDDLGAIARYDEAATGAARGFLLDHLLARLPAAAMVAQRDDRIVGFAMGRDGRRATQVGPIVADDTSIAAALLAAAGRAIAGPIVLDVRDGAARFVDGLAAAGFLRERGFTRMTLGADPMLARTDRLHAVVGPEFG